MLQVNVNVKVEMAFCRNENIGECEVWVRCPLMCARVLREFDLFWLCQEE